MKQEMSKKTYLQPQVKVVDLEQMEIICHSKQTNTFGIQSETGYTEDIW